MPKCDHCVVCCFVCIVDSYLVDAGETTCKIEARVLATPHEEGTSHEQTVLSFPQYTWSTV